jgi:hypothetical protein
VTATAPRAKRAALIIASHDFDDPGFARLRAPARDAETLATLLQDPDVGGFEVQVLVNEHTQVVREAIEEFFQDRRSDDLLLLYFSGHGLKDDRGDLFFVMKNTRMLKPQSTAVEASYVRAQMDGSRSRRILVVIDCCYSGAFLKGYRSRGGEEVDVRDHLDGRGRAVITASRATQYAFEADELTAADDTPSVFTSGLVEGLRTGAADRDGDGWITVDELYDYVYDHVRGVVGSQTPGKWSDVEGEIRIARNRNTPAPLPLDLTRAIASENALERLGAVATLTDWLRSEDARRVLTAEDALRGLADDHDRRVFEAVRRALDEPLPEPPAPPPAPSPGARQRLYARVRNRRTRRPVAPGVARRRTHGVPLRLMIVATLIITAIAGVFAIRRDDNSASAQLERLIPSDLDVGCRSQRVDATDALTYVACNETRVATFGSNAALKSAVAEWAATDWLYVLPATAIECPATAKERFTRQQQDYYMEEGSNPLRCTEFIGEFAVLWTIERSPAHLFQVHTREGSGESLASISARALDYREHFLDALFEY